MSNQLPPFGFFLHVLHPSRTIHIVFSGGIFGASAERSLLVGTMNLKERESGTKRVRVSVLIYIAESRREWSIELRTREPHHTYTCKRTHTRTPWTGSPLPPPPPPPNSGRERLQMCVFASVCLVWRQRDTATHHSHPQFKHGSCTVPQCAVASACVLRVQTGGGGGGGGRQRERERMGYNVANMYAIIYRKIVYKLRTLYGNIFRMLGRQYIQY